MIRIIQKSSNIQDLLVLEPDIFCDFRGENCETFNRDIYKKLLSEITNVDFIVDSFSFSRKHVLRGFHGDTKTWKLVQCIKGTMYLVVIDTRPESTTFSEHESFNLNDKTRLQILIPAGCVNAHLCMSDECIFNYKLSSTYTEQKDQINIKWNDQRYNIFWPISNPILSERDSHKY